MSVYRTKKARNPPFLGQIVPETFSILIFNIFSFFHTFSGNRKLPLKPLRKLETWTRVHFFSPVIVLPVGRQTERGKNPQNRW